MPTFMEDLTHEILITKVRRVGNGAGAGVHQNWAGETVLIKVVNEQEIAKLRELAKNIDRKKIREYVNEMIAKNIQKENPIGKLRNIEE